MMANYNAPVAGCSSNIEVFILSLEQRPKLTLHYTTDPRIIIINNTHRRVTENSTSWIERAAGALEPGWMGMDGYEGSEPHGLETIRIDC